MPGRRWRRLDSLGGVSTGYRGEEGKVITIAGSDDDGDSGIPGGLDGGVGGTGFGPAEGHVDY